MENNQIENIACYIRVSTQEQKLHGLSLDAQRDTLKRYASYNNLKIVGWYEDEGVSGRKLIKNRPALQSMLTDAESGLFDRIIFIKLDRYFRSVAEYHECQKKLNNCNVTWTATEEKYDLTTASGRFWINQKISMAEYEADNTGERIRLVNDYKIKTGQPLAGSQCQGLAYTVVTDEETGLKKVIPDPETKELCLDYVNHFLIHNNKRAALIYVNDKYGTKHGYHTLSKLLTDTKMYGYYRGNPNYCEPYITKETYDKIQLALQKNIKIYPKRRVYLFTGLLVCPTCNRLLAGTTNQSRTSVKPNGKIYSYDTPLFYYRCNHNKIDNVCNFYKYISERRIEKYLIDHFNKFITGYITDIKIEDVRQQSNHAVEQIKDIKAEMNRLNNMYQKSRITEGEYDRDYEELSVRLKKAESHLEPIKVRDLKPYKKLLESDWLTIYNALNRENKQAFWRRYIKAINLNENGTIKEVIFF